MASILERLGRKPDVNGGLPAWARRLAASPLRPALAQGDDVWVWAVEGDTSTAVISDQFKANAGDYHQRYAHSDHFQRLFGRAIEEAGIRVADRPLILDFGSGSGVNSIVPCQRLFPGARCVASDLSGELLAILAAYLREVGQADEVVCVQVDAMAPHMAAGAFDLVTGAAILHHLERPLDALVAAARALKPGGHAIFFEPFNGWGVLRLAMERILAEAQLRGEPLHPDVERGLRLIVTDVAARTNPDPGSEAFRALDDKWLFSRERVLTMAQKAGFAEPRIVPNNSGPTLYEKLGPIHLRLATGQADLPWPDWAIEILRSFDAALTEQFKRAALIEGAIVLTKPA